MVMRAWVSSRIRSSSAACAAVASCSSERIALTSARAASASACAASVCPAIASAIWVAASARVSAVIRAAFSRVARASAACRASSASTTRAEICASAASGSAAVARASARCSAVSRSAAASCSARSRVLPAVLTASVTGARPAWGSASSVPAGRVLARQAFSGLCTGWPGPSACSQYTGAGPLVPRRGAGGRVHCCPDSYSHRHVGWVAVAVAVSCDAVSLMPSV